jgi:hypothetical protein
MRAVRRGVLSATARLRPSHRAIAMRTVRFSPDNAIRLYLYVAVAPSRLAPRPFDDGQVRRAQGFVAEAFPGVFDPTPRTADESTTLFTVEGDDGYREHQLYVHRTGLVELLWALAYQDDGDALTLDPVEMAYVVMRTAQAVAQKPFAEISRAGRAGDAPLGLTGGSKPAPASQDPTAYAHGQACVSPRRLRHGLITIGR